MIRSQARTLLFCIAFQAIVASSLLHPAFAQGIQTGSLTGTVTDPTGAVVPTATIVIKDVARGTSFTAKAQSDGQFAFSSLPIGFYNINLSAAGFKTTQISRVEITTGNAKSLGKQALSLGTSDTIEVEANSTVALDTSTSQVSASFDSEQIEQLPLNNGFDEVALLVPGVVPTHDVNFSNTNGTGISSNGLRGRSNNFELDGQSNNDNSVSGPQIFFGNQDAIAEIQVIQSNFSAQYGRNTGSVVNYITKSGTNSIHGSAFEIYTGSFLNSYPNQDKNPLFGFCAPGQSPATTGCTPVSPIPRSVDNRYGGTLGVPIIKDKLWAFGSTYFEHTRVGTAPIVSGAQALTPTPAGLTQLAALFPNNPGVAVLTNYGPYGVKFGNPTPIGAVTTQSVTAPNGTIVQIPVSQVIRNAPAPSYSDQEDLGRLDYQATSKDRFFLRYLYQTNLSNNNPDGGAGGTFYDVPDTTHSVGADWTRLISARLTNQLRYSFQESKLDFQAGSFPNCTVNTLTACPGNVSFSDGASLGFGEATNLPQGRTVKVTQVQDNFSFTKGRQTMLMGFEFDQQNSPNIFLPNYNGTFSPIALRNPATGNPTSQLDGLIHQNGSFALATGNPVLPFKENDFAGYFQDDYKLSSNLTLNLGLRYEFFGQAINTLNAITTARESNPATALWNTALPLSARTTPKVNNATKNFEPRVGFSYNPSFFKSLVIRGGYSIGFDPAFYNLFLNFATVAPSAVSASINCGGTCLGTGNFSGASNRNTNLAKLPLGGNPAFADQEFVPLNFHNPYVETYTFGIEQQLTNKLLFSLRYAGNHGIGNFQSIDANPLLNASTDIYGIPLPSVAHDFPKFVTTPLCTTAGAAGLGRPNCALSNDSFISNTAFSIYNSLQTQLSTSNFYGFTGEINYTFAHGIDNSSEVYSNGAGGSTIAVAQNPLSTDQPERGNSATSYPNAISVGMNYNMPKIDYFSSPIARKFVNGFSVHTIYQYTSGQPYNPYQPNLEFSGLTASYCDSVFNESTVGPGADSCRLVLSNPNAPANTVSITDPAVLGPGSYDLSSVLYGAKLIALAPSAAHWTINNAPYAQSVGNPYPGSGRNILRGQTYNNLDASIWKDTKLTERFDMELQLDAYNVLNRQYRGTPLANVFNDTGAPGVANPFLSNAYNGSNNRFVQLAAKIKF